MVSLGSRGRKRSKLTEAEELEQSFPTLNWQQVHSMYLNPPPLPAQVEGRVSFLPSATVMPPSTPDNPSIEDLHNSELVNGRWRLKPAVVEKRLLQKAGGIMKKRVLARLTGILGPEQQGSPPVALARVHEKTQGKRKKLEVNKEKLQLWKLKTQECIKDLSQKMEVDGNPREAEVMFAEEEGRGNVVKKLVVKKVRTKKMLVKKVKITKPARRLVRRNHNQAGRLANTGIRQKTYEEKLVPERLEKGKLLSGVEAIEVSEGVFWYQGQGKTFFKKPRSMKCVKKAGDNKDMGQMLEKSKAHQNKKVFKANNQHLLSVHREVKPHQCQGCNMKFGCKDDLQLHLACGHGGKKSFAYTDQDCNKEFGHKGKLLNHMKHSYPKLDKKVGGKPENKVGLFVGVEPYHCKECEKKFSRKYSLQRHLLVVHRGVKLHQCQECNMKFGQKNDLKEHLVCRHGGKKLFPCTEQDCSKEFGVKRLLLNHLRKKHSYQ